jgi:hypothetical protein
MCCVLTNTFLFILFYFIRMRLACDREIEAVYVYNTKYRHNQHKPNQYKPNHASIHGRDNCYGGSIHCYIFNSDLLY